MAPDELFDLIEVAVDEVGKIAENLGNLLESVSEFTETAPDIAEASTPINHESPICNSPLEKKTTLSDVAELGINVTSDILSSPTQSKSTNI